MIDLSTYDGSIAAGMFLDVPPPGSIHTDCDGCGGDIILGPKTQQVIAENPGVEIAKLCIKCIVRYRLEHPDADFGVHQSKDVVRGS